MRVWLAGDGHTLLLYPEGIGRLAVKVCCVLPFLLSAAEEAEAAGGALGCFVGFLEQEPGVLRHDGLVGGGGGGQSV